MRKNAGAILKWPFWNSSEKRFRMIWRITGTLFLFLLLTGIIVLIPAAIMQVISENPVSFVSPVLLDLIKWSSMLLTLLATLVAVWLSAVFLDRRRFTDFGFRMDAAWWKDLGFGLLLGAFLMVVVFLVEWLLGWIEPVFIPGSTRTVGQAAGFLVMSLVGFISVGVYEEIMMRGYLLKNLAEGLRPGSIHPLIPILMAWLLSSIIFGLGHGDNPNASTISTINIIIAGIFLGLAYVLTGELAIPVGIHIAWNYFQGPVLGFPVSGTDAAGGLIRVVQQGPSLWTGGQFGPEAGILGLLAMLLGSGLILLWLRRQGKLQFQYGLVRAQFRHQSGLVPEISPEELDLDGEIVDLNRQHDDRKSSQ